MNNNQDKNICYVFSPATAESAVQEWLNVMIESEPKKEEAFQIFAVALPWFLAHIQKDASIYMFTHDDFIKARTIWKEIQLKSYPNQQNRIDETCDLFMLFFQSDVVREHKMIVNA